jgi:hypothetical protein
VNARRWIVGAGLGVLVAAGLAVAPAIATDKTPVKTSKKRPVLAIAGDGFGAFTPTSADPRLAAAFAKGGFDTSGFRFTPSDSRRSDGKAVTVAVRARTVRGTEVADRNSATAAAVSLAPIAYSLGVGVGWQRFAVTGDLSRVDLAGAPGSRESADLSVSYAGHRFTGRVKADAQRPLPGAPSLTAEEQSYALDLGGSYSLTRNLDVTAGLRYKSERDGLVRLQDDRRDSQAVYVGTAFRF